MSQWKKVKGVKQKKEEEEEEKRTMGTHRDGGEKRRDSSLRTNVDMAWNRTVVAPDPGMECSGQQFLSNGDESDGRFQCPECNDRRQGGTKPNLMRWSNSIMAGMDAERDTEKRRVRMTDELERNGLWRPQGVLNSAHSDKCLAHRVINSYPWQDFGQTPETLKAHRGVAEVYTAVVEDKRHKSLHCRTCNRTYKPPEGAYFDMRDSALFSRFPSQYEGSNKSANPNRSDPVRNSEFRREVRNVTFDLRRSPLELKGGHGGDMREEGEEEVRQRKSKVQPGRAVKVKLNLNPLRKSKVYPKRRSDQGHSERGSPQKGRDKRKKEKDQDVEKKEKSGKKTEKSSHKASKAEASCDEEKKDQSGEGRGEQCDQGVTSEPAAAARTPDQSSTGASGQEHNMLAAPLQYHGAAGSTLASGQLASQLPLSLSISNGNNGPNLSLLSSLASSSLPLQGGNFLLNSTAPGPNPALNPRLNPGLNQGLNPELNLVLNPRLNLGLNQGLNQGVNTELNQALNPRLKPGLNPGLNPGLKPEHNPGLNQSLNTPLNPGRSPALNPGLNPSLNPSLNPGMHPTPNSGLAVDSEGLVPIGITVDETSLALSGSSCSVERPAGSDVLPAYPSYPVHAGPGIPNTQPARETANLAVGPAPLGPLSTFPDSGSGPAPGSGPHIGAVSHPMLPAVQSLPPPPQLPLRADGSPAAVTTVESLSVSQTRTEVAGRVPPPPGEMPAGESGDNGKVTDEPVSGVLAASTTTQNESSAGDITAAAAAGLLQQEYLSEEGGSSPRRKLKLVIPEKMSSRPPTALERKIR